MPGNSNLHDSSRNKQDEFYTNLQLIEDELKHYRSHFKGKRVLCNCDDLHEYDLAGNSITAAYNSITNDYTANNLNQYTSVGRRAPTPPPAIMLTHDIDGNLTNCAPWTFTWDSGNRLTAVSSNGVQVAAYAYDAFGRRVKKATAASTTYFFYDGWNLVREIEVNGNVTNTIEYAWGKDLSGSFQGAGGVGGLLYERRNGAIYIPFQDAFGNIMGYWDTNGTIVAEYTYDAFGRTIAQSGSMADVFRHRFSTKYLDMETGFYYYGYRYYFLELRRWLSRDPLEEEGNLYLMVNNNCLNDVDVVGERSLKKSEPWVPYTTTWSEHHSWNCSEWPTLSNQKSGGRKDGYIEHFERYTFKNRGVPASAIAGFAYAIPNVLGMDSNASSCWCLTVQMTVFRRKFNGKFQYKLTLFVKNLDEHPRCCEKQGKHRTDIENHTFEIGPY